MIQIQYYISLHYKLAKFDFKINNVWSILKCYVLVYRGFNIQNVKSDSESFSEALKGYAF